MAVLAASCLFIFIIGIVMWWFVNTGTSSRLPSGQTPPSNVAESNWRPQSIRFVDFANFTYPTAPIFNFGEPTEPVFQDRVKSFTLRAGRYEGSEGEPSLGLGYLGYGDVTGDGVEEAIVTLGVLTKGTAIPHVTYIYASSTGVPKLLWAFSTGDRQSNGLRQIYAEKGRLVLERYTGNTKDLPFRVFVTRTRYKWHADHFEQEEPEETSENSDYRVSPIMPHYIPKP